MLGFAFFLADISCLPVIFNIGHGFHKINPADPPLELDGYSYLFDIDKASNRLNKVCVMKKENSVEAPKCYSYDASYTYSLCPSVRNDCLPAYFQLVTVFGIVSYSVGFTVIDDKMRKEYHIKSDYSDTIWKMELYNSQDSAYIVWIELFGGESSLCFISFIFFLFAFVEFGAGLIPLSCSCILCTYHNCRKMHML